MEGLWQDKGNGAHEHFGWQWKRDEKLGQRESEVVGTRAGQDSEQIGESMNPTL